MNHYRSELDWNLRKLMILCFLHITAYKLHKVLTDKHKGLGENTIYGQDLSNSSEMLQQVNFKSNFSYRI